MVRGKTWLRNLRCLAGVPLGLSPASAHALMSNCLDVLISPDNFSYLGFCDCVSPRTSHCVFQSVSDMQKKNGIGR
ncbi:hypothetical protein BDW62DRAFT_98277 [Aspergillus aurantiobrunneus]